MTALTRALDDYTTDQRGDVGSWIRAAAVDALARLLSTLAPSNSQFIPQEAFMAATAGIAKQAVEKLDVVRDAATAAWQRLLDAQADSAWEWPAAREMDHKPSTAWFTAGLTLLDTPARPVFLAGLIQSTGSNVRASVSPEQE